VHRQRGTRVYFHQAIHDKKIIAIPGIHYFDAHRLQALLLNAPELQLHPRTGNLPEPEGAALKPMALPEDLQQNKIQ
jgi:hypothetical protein